MAKERKENSFIKKPIYPGGTKAFRQFIKDNLKYPKEAIAKKIEGTVYLRYSINHKGQVTETQVLKGIGQECDREAERILKLLKFEIPKGPRKLRVLFHQKTQITFRLPKAKPKKSPAKPTSQNNTKLVYNYTPTKKSKEVAKKQGHNKTYTYTINYS